MQFIVEKLAQIAFAGIGMVHRYFDKRYYITITGNTKNIIEDNGVVLENKNFD